MSSTVELRTSANYAHKLELVSTPAERAEARRRFADSPVKLVGIGETIDDLIPFDPAEFVSALVEP